MKKEIIERIIALGGDTGKIQGKSLAGDVQAIELKTPLYKFPEDTPWATAGETPPVHGINEFVKAHYDLWLKDKKAFYQLLTTHYYTPEEDPRRREYYYDTWPVTPFTEGTADYDEWYDLIDDDEREEVFRIIEGNKPEFMIIAWGNGYPSNYFICPSDPNPENPMVYYTDHEEFFQEVGKEGTLEEFFNRFMTPTELTAIVDKALEKNREPF